MKQFLAKEAVPVFGWTEGAYEICKLPLPWEFHKTRDTRTVYDVCGFDYKSIPFDGEPHNALHDAVHQVKLVQAALRKRNEKLNMGLVTLRQLAALGGGNSEGNSIAINALQWMEKE